MQGENSLSTKLHIINHNAFARQQRSQHKYMHMKCKRESDSEAKRWEHLKNDYETGVFSNLSFKKNLKIMICSFKFDRTKSVNEDIILIMGSH